MVPVNVVYAKDQANLNVENAMARVDSLRHAVSAVEMVFALNASEREDTGLGCTTIVAKPAEVAVTVARVAVMVKKIYGVAIAKEQVK